MQNVNCKNLTEYVSTFSLVQDCDIVKNGAIRITTPFTYPNGSFIDVFLKPNNDLYSSYTLSDYGQTAQYLYEMGFNLTATRKRLQTIDDVCRTLGTKYKSGFFEIEFGDDNLNNLSNFIVNLSQTCIRIADLSFTQRLQTYATFDDDIEEFIEVSGLEYEVSPDNLIGVYEKPVKVDFRVLGNNSKSLIQTWSTRNSYQSHLASNEIYVRWLALNNYLSSYQFITVYDDNENSLRDDDFSRLYETSTVFGFPNQREQFRETISV